MKKIISTILITGFILVVGCKKDHTDPNDEYKSVTVSTGLLSSGYAKATISGEILVVGDETVGSRGICLGTEEHPTTTNSNTTTEGSGTGTFQSTFSNLASMTTYYARAYATVGNNIQYGNEISFDVTPDPTLATVTTSAVSGITYTTAIAGGNVTSIGGSAVTDRGICYNTLPNPTVTTSLSVQAGTGSGAFTANIANLSAGTIYYLKAYAKNYGGIVYGNQITFSTTASPFTIGQSYQGGKIFYIDNSGLHGWIAATMNQSTNSDWMNAVSICDNLVLGGYSDWYLPSQNELIQIYVQRVLIGGFTGPVYYYWSSNGSSSSATVIDFATGYPYIIPSNTYHAVRAMRTF